MLTGKKKLTFFFNLNQCSLGTLIKDLMLLNFDFAPEIFYSLWAGRVPLSIPQVVSVENSAFPPFTRAAAII